MKFLATIGEHVPQFAAPIALHGIIDRSGEYWSVTYSLCSIERSKMATFKFIYFGSDESNVN
jgi:hypothetical protein